jgi:hypothetical protein
LNIKDVRDGQLYKLGKRTFLKKTIPETFCGNDEFQPKTRIYFISYELKTQKAK